MYYDGGCPLCSREVRHYRRLDSAHRVRWVDIDQTPEVLAEIGVAKTDAMRRLHATDANGVLHTGAFAFHIIWQALPRYRWLAKVVSCRRVLLFADFVYNKFANWRYDRRSGCACNT